MRIRTYTPQDYQAIVALRNAVHSEPVSAAILADSDRRSDAHPQVVWTRFVAEDETGAVVAYANSGRWTWTPERHFSLYVTVRADRRRRGIGTRLLAAAEEWALQQGAINELTAFMQGGDEVSFEWATGRGYYLDLQRTESVLFLKDWDGAAFAGHLEQVRSSGLDLLLLTEGESEDLLRGMYDLEAVTAPDVPDYEGHMPSWQEWRQDWVAYTGPRIVALGLHGDQVVGMSTLFLPRIPDAGASTGYTGVRREYRGRGLALALKLLTIAEAAKRGVPRMRTNNDLDNPAMLAVNARLGYVMVPGPRRLKKKL